MIFYHLCITRVVFLKFDVFIEQVPRFWWISHMRVKSTTGKREKKKKKPREEEEKEKISLNYVGLKILLSCILGE